jgi:hypothetical protein
MNALLQMPNPFNEFAPAPCPVAVAAAAVLDPGPVQAPAGAAALIPLSDGGGTGPLPSSGEIEPSVTSAFLPSESLPARDYIPDLLSSAMQPCSPPLPYAAVQSRNRFDAVFDEQRFLEDIELLPLFLQHPRREFVAALLELGTSQ